MSLEMRERCETCGQALAADGEAFICSYECTYCPSCAEASPRCPNCSGELAPRPRRQRSRSLSPATDRQAAPELTDAYARNLIGITALAILKANR